jgi:Ni,Fe-hydrogenase III large subunit
MSAGLPFATVHNGGAIRRDAVPSLSGDAFREVVTGASARAERVVALFGHPTAAGPIELSAVMAADGRGLLHLCRTVLEDGRFASMTPGLPQVHLFEREIAEAWGIVPEGHPWLKPVRFTRSQRPGDEGWGRQNEQTPVVGRMPYYAIEGEEVHEVAVGPVHAGVIEPGHFRFQCHGEHVFHLEISLGYQHRGIERALVGGPSKRTIHYMETLAGDTSVGHATAYCQIIEALSRARVSARAHALRGICLELERLANHTGNLGALANDIGFQPTAAACGRLRGEFLNITAQICGNRFGRGMVRPGGVGFDVDGARGARIIERLEAADKDVEAATNLLIGTSSVQTRFEATGRVSRETAVALGLVGVVARACGLPRDARQDHPSGIFRFVQIPVSVWDTGDVFARAYVRWREVKRSVAFVREQLRRLPQGASLAPCDALAADHVSVSLIEGWRGEICHVALTDAQGRFVAYKVADPSFHNWMGLAMALRDQQISDFPLCNKSFDLSYCGFDL